MFFDPMYFIFLLPAIALAGWAQLKVRSAIAEAREVPAKSRLSGAEAATYILRSHGLQNVGVEVTSGVMGDHYDPRAKVLRLSPDVYHNRSVASLSIAAHEAGHAIQDAEGYAPLTIRNAVVPMASFGSNASWFLLFAGYLFQSYNLILVGIGLFSVVVFFQIVNLPVEYNASARAKEILTSNSLITPQEDGLVKRVLSAAALTYVAATVTSLLTLLYYLMRFGVLGGDRK